MRRAWRHGLLAWVCVLALPWTAWGAETRDPGAYFFQSTFGDLHEELTTARAEGKLGVLLMFEMDECPFCHRMKTTVLNQVAVQDYYRKHFRIFAIDIEGDVELTDFSGKPVREKDFAFEQHRVRATPVFAFFDLDGQTMTRYTGATRDAAEFLRLGEYVVSGAYKTQPFARYKRDK